MSFIYDDKKLINDLLKSAIDFENKFLKKGQKAVPNEEALDKSVSVSDKARIALTFVDDIERSITGDTGNITSNKEGGTELTPMSMESLGALIEFLASAEIMINFQRIAYYQHTPPSDPKKYTLYKLEGNTLFSIQEGPERKQEPATKAFYVNNELLIAYLKSLQAEAYSSKNRLMSGQLGTLIEEANNLGLQVGPYKPPAKPGEKPEEKPGEKSGELTQEQLNALANLASPDNLPLMRNTLDFARIRGFLNDFRAFLKNSQYKYASGITQQIDRIETDISDALKLVKSPVPSIGLSDSDSYETVSQTLNELRSYSTYVGLLSQIVNSTASLVGQLYSMYPNVFNSPQMSNALGALKQQNLFKATNITRITSWYNNRDKVTRVR